MFSFDPHGKTLEENLAGVEYRLKQTLAIAGGRDESTADLYCVCLGPDSGLMVECEACNEWYHPYCVNLETADIQNSLFLCSLCDARARADKPRLLGDYPTIGRIEQAVMESRSFGLVVSALDPLVTLLLDAKALVELLGSLSGNRVAESAPCMDQPAHLRSLLRALLGLGINLKSGILDGLWAGLSELLKDEPIPKIIPGTTITSRRSSRGKPVSAMPEAGSPERAVANGMPTLPLDESQKQALSEQQGQLDQPEAVGVDAAPAENVHSEVLDIYVSRLEDLGLYIMNPPPADLEMGQGLLPARDAFRELEENCLCNVKGSELDDSNPMTLLPTIMCDDCSLSFHTECAQVPIDVARVIAFNQLRILVNAEVDNIPAEPSRFSCPSCCISTGENYKFGDVFFE
ncbi:hypothetical protein GGH91_004927 [Coemansia sp. RSA 2671]|nr:hypothetical protein GGH91_004927 [Coemansia sp. RSA 2671]